MKTVIFIVLLSIVLAFIGWTFAAWLICGVILPLFGVVVSLTFWQYVLIGLGLSIISNIFSTKVTVNK